MKRCPTCERTYADETVKFCRVDGATLIEDSATVAEDGTTHVLAESRATSEAPTETFRSDTGQAPSTTSTLEPKLPARGLVGRREFMSRRKLALIITLFVLIIVVVAGYFLYRRARDTEVAIDSIAVLPFENQNRDANIDYLSDGITENIISSLSQLTQLRVMARSTVFSYKGKEVDPRKVGRDLGVRAVLTGRVIQQGDNLTISTELVNAADGTELWGQRYNRKLTDVFALQEEMAREISEKLRLKLNGAERQQLAKRPTENLKAFQYYIQGRAYVQRHTREDLLESIRYFEKALEEDPNYALAYAGLADTYASLGLRSYIAPSEGGRKAEDAALKAVALDENLAEAHAALGQASATFAPFNFSLADRELRRAIELSPSLALAHQVLGFSLLRQGRLDEGLQVLLKGRELDPLLPNIARGVAYSYYLKRDYARALELLRQSNKLGPTFVNSWEIEMYIQNRSFDEALSELEKAKRERKDDLILIYSTAMVHATQGKRAEALQIIKEREQTSGASLSEAHWIAQSLCGLEREGTGPDVAGTWLSNRSNRSLL